HARTTSTPPSFSSEASEDIEQLVDLPLSVVLRAGSDGVGDARLDVASEKELLDLLQRALHGGDLKQDVDAVRVGVDHALESLDLSFDPSEPPDGLRLRRRVDHRYPQGVSVHPRRAPVNGPVGRRRRLSRTGMAARCSARALDVASPKTWGRSSPP